MPATIYQADALTASGGLYCDSQDEGPRVDAGTPDGRMFSHMLGAFAEFERAMIRERCAPGIKAARVRGQKFGRERSLPAKTEAKLVCMYQSQKYTLQALADHFEVHMSSAKHAIYRVT